LPSFPSVHLPVRSATVEPSMSENSADALSRMESAIAEELGLGSLTYVERELAQEMKLEECLNRRIQNLTRLRWVNLGLLCICMVLPSVGFWMSPRIGLMGAGMLAPALFCLYNMIEQQRMLSRFESLRTLLRVLRAGLSSK
jgi:hypothetical protein